MFTEKAIEHLKEDAIQQKVPLIEVIRTAVQAPLITRDTKDHFDFYGIPNSSEEWDLADIRRIQSVTPKEYVCDNFDQFTQLLNCVLNLGNTYGEDYEFSLEDFAKALSDSDIHHPEIVSDLIEAFAGNAGFNAMSFLQKYDEVPESGAVDKFSTASESMELELVTEKLITHVRSALSAIVFPKK